MRHGRCRRASTAERYGDTLMASGTPGEGWNQPMSLLPPSQRPARLDVGVISAGRVGAVLGAALVRAGHRVAAVAAVSRRSRERAATLLPNVAVRPPDEVAAVAELLLLAVPDDALADLVVGLANTGVG